MATGMMTLNHKLTTSHKVKYSPGTIVRFNRYWEGISYPKTPTSLFETPYLERDDHVCSLDEEYIVFILASCDWKDPLYDDPDIMHFASASRAGESRTGYIIGSLYDYEPLVIV